MTPDQHRPDQKPTPGGHCGQQLQCPGGCACGAEVAEETGGDRR